MAEEKSTAIKTIEPGIRYKSKGFEVYVAAGGRKATRYFPVTTSMDAMRLWRDQTKRRLEREGRMLLLPALAPPPRAASGGYIYFAQMGDFVKIGKAKDVAQRLSELQTAHPQPLTLVAFFYCEFPRRIEAIIHAEHQESKARGEWFRLTEKIMELVEHYAKSWHQNMAP